MIGRIAILGCMLIGSAGIASEPTGSIAGMRAEAPIASFAQSKREPRPRPRPVREFG